MEVLRYLMMSKTFMEEHVGDYLIEGEGEKTYRDFVEYKLGGKKFK